MIDEAVFVKIRVGSTYGLGTEASSSKLLTSGDATGTWGAYGRLSPMGLCERPR